ncbi:hypothetical protein L3556_11395 [Candidatus Synechococcus calcipolaris G9]|uniref:Uncharacterized protein n=1 Tax=Candidatus Synechococcus calcipolaris G9 TaxID=1497997 RepID=A0ABT6F119_9SYNE|nr:hypothetical protein [Candidatus Synechococcus calcipolaris]MDG2991529.1 hypothetical protein [Candidatus Synechococcus calcipolaris G9]
MSKPIPPSPPGWNKTISDLYAEMVRGERASVGSPEVDWARDYERRLIPPDMRFPRKGDVYEALEDMTVHYMTSWAVPFTGGGEGLLKEGDRVIVDSEPHDSRAISTYASAVDYEALEARIVPASDRKAPQYGGFYFSFKTVDLNRKFKLVNQEEDSHG